MARVLALAGGVCWLVVGLTHVAERWHVLPAMGWGLPSSPGHYLDLLSAVTGAILLVAAFLAWQFAKRDAGRSSRSSS